MRASLILTITFALAVTAGCGTDAKSADKDRAPLSAHQYREIDRLYTGQVDAEKLLDAGKARRSAERASGACADTDTSDRLLASLVENCVELLARMASLAASDCQTKRECERTLRRMADVADQVIASLRRTERTIVATVPEGECRRALAPTSEMYDAFEGLAAALSQLATAIESGDQKSAGDAAASLEQGEAALDELPSARELRADFREACAAV